MKEIPLSKVNKYNSNIRQFSDPLWRALRKERWKKTDPSKMGKFIPPNGISVEKYKISRQKFLYYGSSSLQISEHSASFKTNPQNPTFVAVGDDRYEDPVNTMHFAKPDENIDFKCDMQKIVKDYLTPKEANIAKLWLFDNMTQQDIANKLGISQATVSNSRFIIKKVFKEHYFTENIHGKSNKSTLPHS